MDKITIELSPDQLKTLVDVLHSAEFEADAAAQKRHVTFLPNLFNKLTSQKNELAKIREYFKIRLNEF